MREDILVVDDNADDVDLALSAFEQAGLKRTVAVARGGRQALERLFPAGAPAEFPKLVLLDIKMPLVSGFEVLSRIRAEPRASELVVVMFSSSSEPADRQRALSLGADAYWRKPMRFEDFVDLVGRIEDLLSKGRRRP